MKTLLTALSLTIAASTASAVDLVCTTSRLASDYNLSYNNQKFDITIEEGSWTITNRTTEETQVYEHQVSKNASSLDIPIQTQVSKHDKYYFLDHVELSAYDFGNSTGLIEATLLSSTVDRDTGKWVMSESNSLFPSARIRYGKCVLAGNKF